jgi:ribosomal RNA assembly protein
MEQLKIPKERIACLIGIKGNTKKKIEKLTRTRIEINSDEGDIIINSEDPLDSYICKDVVRAIGRGFNPDIALSILKEGNCLEVMEIKEFSRDTRNDIKRLKSRLIGEKGKARREIERISSTNICIYGKTVCIIGKQENVIFARQSIEKLLKGAKHSNVFLYMRKRHSSETEDN